MLALVQRVSRCKVTVESTITGQIDTGLLVYLGVEKGDNDTDFAYLVSKVGGLRIFPDEQGKMNLSVKDIEGEVLVVSQFTLCADTRKGKRPSYNRAEDPQKAEQTYRSFITALRGLGIPVAEGQFGAMMQIDYVNNGPVSILLDSRKRI